MSTIVITTNDEKKFTVEKSRANMSPFIKDLMENLGSDGEIPLPNVDGPTFEKIIQYWAYHENDTQGDAPPTEEVKKAREEWDKNFCQMDPKILLSLFRTASYLHLDVLGKLVAKAISALILDKPPREVCQNLGVTGLTWVEGKEYPSEWTPEVEAQIKAENQWAVQEGVDDPRTEEEKARMRNAPQQDQDGDDDDDDDDN